MTAPVTVTPRQEAYRWMGRLPREQFDLLLVLVHEAEDRSRQQAEAASKAREDALEALTKAAVELRDDLLMRAEIDREGIAVVAAGNGVWCRFNDALDALLARAKATEQ